MTEARSKWKEISLGELGKWITGSTPKSSNPLNFGNDVDFVTPSDISYGGILGPSERQISHLGASSVRKVKAPSVNLVCIGTIGKVALARREVTTNQQINSLEVDKAVADPNFVMWLLSSPEIQEKLWESASSTTVAILNKGNLEKIRTHIPSLPEQHKIVEILEGHLARLDAALADVKQAKLKAAQFRRSLLQAAFTGNLSGDGTRLMTAWKTKAVGELADTQLGKMLNKGKQSGKYAKPYLRTDNVHWGSFDLSEIKEMDILPDEETKYLATKGDLLMCEGGASGRTAIWNEDYDISFQNHVHRIRPKNPKEITPKYLLYFFEWFIKNGFANDLIKGVTISSLSQSGLRSIEVSYPPLPEQQKIVEIFEGHLSRLDASVAIADAMEKQFSSLRRSLLQAAFTGQLTKEVASV
jgi:type I restriction enzyme S subunit